MLNLSRIQLELERAKEKLRNVEETIQKVEGKTFSNGPVRYGGLKIDYHLDKNRNPAALEDVKNPRRRVIASAVDSRIQRLPADDSPFSLKRSLRDKRESGLGLKRQGGDGRPQGVFARLSAVPFHQADEDDEDDFGKKPTLPSRVYTTAAEVPSRQEVIAAQAQDEQSKERNKRMFGALVGTLQKFRKEETRVREREEKRMRVEKKLEEDAKREKEKLMQEKRELFLEKKRREVEIKRIEWSLNRVKEYEAWEADVIPLKNFIQTQAKPHIFYLPNVHNAKTEERLAHSQKLVERMIEKRKTNLKEEIENSEKKARKAAAEEAEEEEAENIPEDNEESCKTEQQIQVDFETKSKENGFFEDKKNQNETSKNEDPNEAHKEKDWVGPDSSEAKKSIDRNEVLEEEKEETKNALDAIGSKNSSGGLNTSAEEKHTDEAGEDSLDKRGERNENKLYEMNQCEENKSESLDVKAEERTVEPLKGNNVQTFLEETEKNVKGEGTNIDFVKSDENLEPSWEKTTESKPFSESEQKTDESFEKKSEALVEKTDAGESSLDRDKSQRRKTNTRSKTPKRSPSPKDSRSKLQRSGSHQKRGSRRQSSSSSPPRKSHKSMSPGSRRGLRNFTSKKRSSPSKSRRQSCSQSLSSASPRKERSRSSSSGYSKPD